MASLKQVTRNDVAVVLEEFRQEADQFMAVTLGSDDYIRTVLTKALGSDRAAGLIEDILEAGEGGSGIDALNWLDPHTVAELIGDEHPQIIATILVHLERDRAAGVLALLTDRLRNDVMLRIATFGGVQPAALSELTDVLNSVLAGQGAKAQQDGRRAHGGRDPEHDELDRRGNRGRQPARARCRPGAEDHRRDVRVRQPARRRRPRHPAHPQGNRQRHAHGRAQGAQEELRASSCATCPAAPPRCCARTWKRKARSACPRSRPSRRRSCRSPAAWPSGQIVLGNSGDDAYV